MQHCWHMSKGSCQCTYWSFFCCSSRERSAEDQLKPSPQQLFSVMQLVLVIQRKQKSICVYVFLPFFCCFCFFLSSGTPISWASSSWRGARARSAEAGTSAPGGGAGSAWAGLATAWNAHPASRPICKAKSKRLPLSSSSSLLVGVLLWLLLRLLKLTALFPCCLIFCSLHYSLPWLIASVMATVLFSQEQRPPALVKRKNKNGLLRLFMGKKSGHSRGDSAPHISKPSGECVCFDLH